MSLILDALNRSRDNVEPVPTLSTHHPVVPVPAGSRQYLPWVVVILALAVVAWLVWDRLSTPSVPPAVPDSPVAELTRNIGSAATAVTSELIARAEERQEASSPPPLQPVPAASGAAEVSEVTADSDALPREVPATGPEVPAVDAAPAESEVAVPAPAVADTAVARLYRDRSVGEDAPDIDTGPEASATVDRPNEQAIDIEEVLRRAQAETGNAGLADHPVPFLSSLSQQAKNEIPTIYYRRHDYSSDAGKSTVTLNGKTVGVGGSPGAGLKVEEILPDSVVLSYRGTQFRLRALNSWVNL